MAADQTTAAYEAGRQARSTGKTWDDNPHQTDACVVRTSKAGTRFYIDEQAASDWNRGFRDEADAIRVKKRGGPDPELSNFVSRRRRRRAW